MVDAIKSSWLNPINRSIFPSPPVSYDENLNGLFWIPKQLDNPSIPCTLHCPKDDECERNYILIYCHKGSTDLGRINVMLNELSNLLGLYIIAWEYTGYGIATKNNETTSETNTYRDILHVVNYVRFQLNWPSERIILIGNSLGCGMATYCAHNLQENRVKIMGLILLNSFTSIRELAFATKGILGGIVMNRYNNRLLLKQLRCPLLLSHGKKNKSMPYGMSITLMEEYNGNDIKQFHGSEDSGEELNIKEDIVKPIHTFILDIEEKRKRENIMIPNIPKHDYKQWQQTSLTFHA